ncbi:Siroheme synthase [Thalassocella blandensis]|nr:Siroheme synthase [Thalassocella blandensis]
MQSVNENQRKAGRISLVGAGPGDPDLLTVKAMKAINSADLIFFDQLVSAEIRALFPQGKPAFYVGKQKNKHSFTQEQINRLIVLKAQQGLHVVRLKGGDPFVFGRGGEELLQAASAGVEVDVVPGITAASGCTTAASIPLTHRGLSQACTFITAHAEKDLTLDWSALARLDQTLVIYMGISRASFIRDQLLCAGMKASTPIAIIENGCRQNQREILGCLNDLEVLVEVHAVTSPAIIVVGDVVLFKAQLQRAQASASAHVSGSDDDDVGEALLSRPCA